MDEECKHLKVYDEESVVNVHWRVLEWHCVWCHCDGITDKTIDLIHTYDGLVKIRKAQD